jgi:fatty-acyl-CoA synthase
MNAKLSQSYVSGTSSEPLIGDTIGRLFDKTVARFPDRDALIVRHQGIRWTYAELKRRVDAVAAGFVALGLKPGDRVGIWSPNNAEWTLTQFATAKAGIILVNINPAYRVHELEYVLNKVGCAALVTIDAFKGASYVDMVQSLMPERLPHLKTVIRIGGEGERAGTMPFSALETLGGDAERAEIARLEGVLQFDDPINIQFTSGTTGSPKGATLTHHNILNNGYFTARGMRFTEADRLCIPVPLYHCFGMVMGNLGCITHGACMVYPSEAFDAKAVLEAVAAERCTALYGVPTMFIAELEHPEFHTYDLKSLRTGLMAGAPCPIEVMKRVIKDMHMSEVGIAYGMTETSPVSFQTSVDDPIERRVSTVGRVHPHVEVKVVDTDGRVVPPGTPGELCTRAYSVMRGYWDDPEKTAEAVDEAGWMHTGDLATIDEDGYCDIVGRIKDMIIRGGENVYPREVEDFLYTHPSVEAVQVFGVPDQHYGEVVCAWIRVRGGASLAAEEVQAYCKGRIAHYKIPSLVRFVDEFPMTVTGKAQKFQMRDAMVAELQGARARA